jgi:hypothetical protein
LWWLHLWASVQPYTFWSLCVLILVT